MNAIHSTIESKSHGSTKQLILCKLLLVLIGACVALSPQTSFAGQCCSGRKTTSHCYLYDGNKDECVKYYHEVENRKCDWKASDNTCNQGKQCDCDSLG